jgi:C1A family cysteine protease
MKKQIIIISILAIIGYSNAFAQNFLKVTKSNIEQTISLATGQVLEISLPCNPSTGYGWYAVSDDNHKANETIKQIGDWEFVPNTSNKVGMLGQPGDQIIRFAGVSQGTTKLKMEYKRPWGKNKPAVDEYLITVVSEGKYTGSYTPSVTQQQPINKHIASASSSLPSSFSWQPQCTSIKNQEQCGSCWAFSTAGTFEADINIIDGNTRDISEQWLINCDAGSNGCQGGWFSTVCDMFQNDGIVYESDCPYADSSCLTIYGDSATCINACGTYPHHEKINSYAFVPGENSQGIPPDSAIKRAIYNYGPVECAIVAGNNFQNYTGGVFTTSDGTVTDHGVMLVGWDDSGGWWILKNSWGTNWGETGYMRIAYGVSAVGSYSGYVTYKSGISHLGCNTLLWPNVDTPCGWDSLSYWGWGNADGYATGNDGWGDQEDAQKYNNTVSGTISAVSVGEQSITTTNVSDNTYVKIYSVDAITKAPSTLLGTSDPVPMSAISTNFAYVNYTFATPVNVTGAFCASLVLPTINGDTLVVSASPGDCNDGDSLSWEKFANGTWHSFVCPQNFGPSYNPELAIFPELCSTSLSGIASFTNPEDNISIYPNPANDNVTVENNNFTIGQTISVYDIQGQLLLQQPMQQAKTNIDISIFSKGLYFLKVENGTGVAVKKFMKE